MSKVNKPEADSNHDPITGAPSVPGVSRMCNTILKSAVLLALACSTTAMAQSGEECANEAMQLSSEVEQSMLSESAKADLTKALRDVHSGSDPASCEQVVSRVRQEMAASTGEAGIEHHSATKDGDSSAAGADEYEQGHASADESLPNHPGAADNDSSAAGVSADAEIEHGYASPGETMKTADVPAGARTADAPSFSTLDANHDASISREEASSNSNIVEQWDTLDADHNGSLSSGEFSNMTGMPGSSKMNKDMSTTDDTSSTDEDSSNSTDDDSTQ
jgi:hypothetical protein